MNKEEQIKWMIGVVKRYQKTMKTQMTEVIQIMEVFSKIDPQSPELTDELNILKDITEEILLLVKNIKEELNI